MQLRSWWWGGVGWGRVATFTHTCTLHTCTRTWCWRGEVVGWSGVQGDGTFTLTWICTWCWRDGAGGVVTFTHTRTLQTCTRTGMEGEPIFFVTLGHDCAILSAAQSIRSVSSWACSSYSHSLLCRKWWEHWDSSKWSSGSRMVNNTRLVGALLKNMLVNCDDCPRYSWTLNTWIHQSKEHDQFP